MIRATGLGVRFGATAALRDASLTVAPGDRLGIVGESGSGKSMLALTLMGMAPETAEVAGSIEIDGREMAGADEATWRRLRARRLAMVFQEPMSALNPLRRIGETIMEPIIANLGLSRREAAARALALLEETGIPEPALRFRQFPHELSGGQRQRALIALALSCDPELLIADEPTTALDANVALRVIELLLRLSESRRMALIFISHDLAAVARATRDVLVMHGGDIVERGPTAEVLARPAHAYTRSLIAARPSPRPEAGRRRPPSSGRDDAMGAPVLKVERAAKRYRLPRRSLLGPAPALTALSGVGLEIRRGETLGVVGESGSGKTTLARLVMAFERPDEGRILFEGEDLAGLSPRDLAARRRRFQMVFQDPFGSLDPRRAVGWSIGEPLRAAGEDRAGIARRVDEALVQVGLRPADARAYPHQFSGGQRQRIAIARAVITRPVLLVADEAVSALDVSVQAQILKLFMDLRDEMGLALLFISHDLAVVGSL
ncbi:MAG: dipeptide ABC transporter ATP-binding protein, partial [Pikeienuella sp.]